MDERQTRRWRIRQTMFVIVLLCTTARVDASCGDYLYVRGMAPQHFSSLETSTQGENHSEDASPLSPSSNSAMHLLGEQTFDLLTSGPVTCNSPECRRQRERDSLPVAPPVTRISTVQDGCRDLLADAAQPNFPSGLVSVESDSARDGYPLLLDHPPKTALSVR